MPSLLFRGAFQCSESKYTVILPATKNPIEFLVPLIKYSVLCLMSSRFCRGAFQQPLVFLPGRRGRRAAACSLKRETARRGPRSVTSGPLGSRLKFEAHAESINITQLAAARLWCGGAHFLCRNIKSYHTWPHWEAAAAVTAFAPIVFLWIREALCLHTQEKYTFYAVFSQVRRDI